MIAVDLAGRTRAQPPRWARLRHRRGTVDAERLPRDGADDAVAARALARLEAHDRAHGLRAEDAVGGDDRGASAAGRRSARDRGRRRPEPALPPPDEPPRSFEQRRARRRRRRRRGRCRFWNARTAWAGVRAVHAVAADAELALDRLDAAAVVAALEQSARGERRRRRKRGHGHRAGHRQALAARDEADARSPLSPARAGAYERVRPELRARQVARSVMQVQPPSGSMSTQAGMRRAVPTCPVKRASTLTGKSLHVARVLAGLHNRAVPARPYGICSGAWSV